MEKEKFLNYICDFMKSGGWEDCNIKDQTRALFTSYCLIFGIDADTHICDISLKSIYDTGRLEEFVNYEEYERFMIQYIV